MKHIIKQPDLNLRISARSVRKPCLRAVMKCPQTVRLTMAESLTTCPSCKKRNRGGGRYCIHCGAILKPVYCSACGTVNPDGLTHCLECGNPIPRLTEIRWGPIVTVLQPTSAMVNEETEFGPPVAETLPSESESLSKGLLSRIRDRFTGKQDEAD